MGFARIEGASIDIGALEERQLLSAGLPEIGVFHADSGEGHFILDYDGNASLDTEELDCEFGLATDTPIIGDWNGDGRSQIGVFRAHGGSGRFFLDYDGDGYLDSGDPYFDYGWATDTPIIGDWNGDGRDDIGNFRAYGGDGIFILDSDGNGAWDVNDAVHYYGDATDIPVIGDWDGATVPFADPDLRAAVHHALAVPLSKHLTPDDMLQLTSLTVDSSLLSSLSGLQYATNLQSLTLIPSDFSQPAELVSSDPLSPLYPLTQLDTLALQGLGLEDAELDPLGSLPSLASLDLRYNQIEAVPSAVAWLPALASLSVHGNPLTDDPQTGLANLAGKLIDVDLAPDHPDEADDIADLADRLYNLPLEMYEYVLNTIEFEPYRGAMKGAEAVLQTGKGNAWDTSFLLTGLLEEAGIQVRYVHGEIDPFYDSQSPDGHGIESWLGVATSGAALTVLNGASLLEYEEETGPFRINHLWLEANLNIPGTGSEWITLDPSIKFRDHRDSVRNMLSEVAFDANPTTGSYFASQRQELTHEYYEAKVRDYLAANDPDTSIADIAYAGPIIAQSIDSVPTSVPYQVISQETAVAEIPAEDTYRIRVSLRDASSGTLYFESNLLSFPEISTLPLTVRPTQPTPPSSNVIPELLLNWETDLESSVDLLQYDYFNDEQPAPPPLDPATNVSLRLEHFHPDGDSDVDYSEPDYPRLAGEYMAIAIDANQISQELIEDQWRMVNEASVAHANNPSSFDENEDIGYLLHLAGMKFFYDTNVGEQIICDLTGATPFVAKPASGITTAAWDRDPSGAELSYYEDLPFPYLPKEMKIDIPNGRWQAIPIANSTTQQDDDRYDMLGLMNSAMEHAIWEELTNIQTISTVKSLQLAREEGSSNPIYEITSLTWATYGPLLTHPQGLKDSVYAEVTNGATVTIPQNPPNAPR